MQSNLLDLHAPGRPAEGQGARLVAESLAGWTISDRSAGFYRTRCKRACDLLVACLLLPCCLPLICLAAFAIMLETGGSPVYRQRRVGARGKSFVLYKLRTMYRDSDRLGCVTEPQDLRVTRIGAFLRDTKIDELPQIINVIKGDMSLIGARPLSVDETDYLVEKGGFDRRTPGLSPSVRPGLTGLEQSTRSSLHPYEHRFALNRYYENNISLWLDMWIVRRTISVCPLVCALVAISAMALTLLLASCL